MVILQDDLDRLKRAVHEMPSNLKWLALWGLSDQSVDVYSLDGGPKCLIKWVSSETLRMRIVCDMNGKILFARCSLPWCWWRLHAWDKVVSYLNTRYISLLSLFFTFTHMFACRRKKNPVAGAMEIVCLMCWPTLVNCVAYPGATPPGWRVEDLSSLQYLVEGCLWIRDSDE